MRCSVTTKNVVVQSCVSFAMISEVLRLVSPDIPFCVLFTMNNMTGEDVVG